MIIKKKEKVMENKDMNDFAAALGNFGLAHAELVAFQVNLKVSEVGAKSCGACCDCRGNVSNP
ncbi:hypothetical protein JCM15765_36720 [Paradesulfitobacterium aromaticivorans]